MFSSSLSIVLIGSSLGGPGHFYLPFFVFSCRGGDIIFPFTIWTLLQCPKSSIRRSTVRHWTSPLHYYCKVTHKGKEIQRSETSIFDSCSLEASSESRESSWRAEKLSRVYSKLKDLKEHGVQEYLDRKWVHLKFFIFGVGITKRYTVKVRMNKE